MTSLWIYFLLFLAGGVGVSAAQLGWLDGKNRLVASIACFALSLAAHAQLRTIRIRDDER